MSEKQADAPEETRELREIREKLALMQREHQVAIQQHQALLQQEAVARLVIAKYEGAQQILQTLLDSIGALPMPIPQAASDDAVASVGEHAEE